jgi:predicted secreted protein
MTVRVVLARTPVPVITRSVLKRPLIIRVIRAVFNFAFNLVRDFKPRSHYLNFIYAARGPPVTHG